MNAQDSTEKSDENETGEDFPSQEIKDKLKGDAIGSTMYTQRFVLSTLLKLKDIKWDEKLEEDLCFLWDSTVEKEVCQYLMDVEFPSVACNVILQYDVADNGRLIEILIGILANMITAKCEKQMDSNQIDIILSVLTCSDSLVLIQVMRFIAIYSVNNKNLITENRAENIANITEFILTNSTNFELIQSTLEALSKITENSTMKVFFVSKVLKTAVDACVRSVTEDGEKDFELFSEEQRKSIKHLIEYVVNFCVYINQSNELPLSNIKVCQNSYIDLFFKITEWYAFQENLLPLTEELVFYFLASNYILSNLNIDYNKNILSNLARILMILIDNEVNDINEFIEMFCYMVHKGNLETIRNDLRSLGHLNIKKICMYLEEQDLMFNFMFEKDNLKHLY